MEPPCRFLSGAQPDGEVKDGEAIEGQHVPSFSRPSSRSSCWISAKPTQRGALNGVVCRLPEAGW
jgi:hypothetical protein